MVTTVNTRRRAVLRVRDMSGSVARYLSGRHSVLKGVPDDADETAAGDTENEICRSVWRVNYPAASGGAFKT